MSDYDPIAAEPRNPMMETIQARLTQWSEGFARVEMPMNPSIMNRQGIVHGGAIVTVMDGAAGFCGCYLAIPGRIRKAMTLSLTTNFIGVAKGEWIIAEARQTGGGRSIFFADIVVKDETGHLIATGTGTFKYRSASQNPEGEPA
ncbi:MAG: PaaI family thioesterase [Neomegalonema sp.]|nr:PaaI family thioesterase [Neomegalonema sp.]